MPSLQAGVDGIKDWLLSDGVRIASIVFVLSLLYLTFRRLFPTAVDRLLRRAPVDEDRRKRLDTLVSVAHWAVLVTVVVIGVLMVLPQLGINITALLTGLGLTGLAIALGAQILVRDIINGILILLEDQFRKGDFVRIGNVEGTVEEVTLRRSVIRDPSGVVHSIPHSLVTVVSNYTRGQGGVYVEVRVAYGEDLERVRRIVDRVGEELLEDPVIGGLVLERPHLRWVESVSDAGVVLRVQGAAKAGHQWEVSSELRRRLMEAFVREGVRVPFPSHVMVQERDATSS